MKKQLPIHLKPLCVAFLFGIAFSLSYSNSAIAQWTAMDSGVTTKHLTGIWGSSGSDIFVSGTSNIVLHFDGEVWSTTILLGSVPISFNDVWGSSGNDVFVVGQLGTILHYDGTYWSEMSSGTTLDLDTVWGSSSKDVFAVGAGGTILHYDGNLQGIWSLMDSGTTSPIQGVWGTSGSNVFAAGNSGLILHYDGNAWAVMSTPPAYNSESISGSSGSNIFAVGMGGSIIHYDGTSWTTMQSGTTEQLFDVWCRSDRECYATGLNGVILRYDGSAWSPENSGTSNRLYGVWGTAEGEVFAVGYWGTILRRPPEIKVEIDINPLLPNIISLWPSLGCVSVAILSDEDFNAPAMVKRDSLTFGRIGDEESFAFCGLLPVDVNRDGYKDLICYFNKKNAAFQCGDTEGILKGETKDGVLIEGRDSVRIIPCR